MGNNSWLVLMKLQLLLQTQLPFKRTTLSVARKIRKLWKQLLISMATCHQVHMPLIGLFEVKRSRDNVLQRALVKFKSMVGHIRQNFSDFFKDIKFGQSAIPLVSSLTT
jgi:hypothetical protein